MGFDFSQLDAQLATLGSVRSDILLTARKLAGDTRSLTEVDQVLAALGSNVQGSAPVARVASAKPKVEARPAPQLVSAVVSPTVERSSEPSQVVPEPLAPEAPAPLASSAARNGPPHSEEIALPDPVHHDASPRSGELTLDDAAPRSGSFALDPPPSESNLDEDTDADFEAEFAALSGPDVGRSTKAKSIRPAAKAESIKAAAKAESVKPKSEAPESIKPPSADDEETDAVLALFDAVENAPESIPAPAAAPIAGLSDELEPSMAPPPGSRDPDAEFDALFDEASSPSSMPSSPAPDQDQDSVDDLLRDLGSPRVPQDLAFKAVQGPALPVADDAGDDPTGIFDMSAFDAVTGGKSGAQSTSALAEDDFEIDMEIDDVLEEDEGEKPKLASGKPMVAPPRPPPQPPVAPGGVEKRPSFLGRLFGGPNPKDPADNK